MPDHSGRIPADSGRMKENTVMSLYVIGDLHLSLGVNKPMDVFGGAWDGYMEKLRRGLSCLTPEDTLVLLGDLCWAMDFESALPDFTFLNEIPGRKILLKGNHDYWWTTMSAFDRFCAEHDFKNIEVLHNRALFYGDLALCGTRGWFFEEEKSPAHDEKVFRRELIRLETSLKAAGEREKYVFLHYPPIYRGYRCEELLDLLKRYGVRHCYYGHLHSESHKLAITGWQEGIEFSLCAADYVNFTPQRIRE